MASGCNFRITRRSVAFVGPLRVGAQLSSAGVSKVHNNYLSFGDQFGVADLLHSDEGRKACAGKGVLLVDLASGHEAARIPPDATGYVHLHLLDAQDNGATAFGLAFHLVISPMIAEAKAAGMRVHVNCHRGRSRSAGGMVASLMSEGMSRVAAIALVQGLRGGSGMRK